MNRKQDLTDSQVLFRDIIMKMMWLFHEILQAFAAAWMS